MATHANSTLAPERTLLREAAAPGRLLPAQIPSPDRQAELLAILDTGPIDPAALAVLSKAQRRRTQAGIDALIDYLDAVTPDADLEPEDEHDPSDHEPNLGAPGNAVPLLPIWWRSVDATCSQAQWAKGCRDDREIECEDEGACIQSHPHDAEPDEPSLGAPEHEMQYRWGWGGIVNRKCSQTLWAGGTLCDLELDLSDSEPALGVPEGDHHQGSWGRSNGSAFEDEVEDWEADWEIEEDERDGPGYREGMVLVAEMDRLAGAA